MRRIFPPFARGAPGIGLLLLRVVVGMPLLHTGIAAFARGNGTPDSILLTILGLMLLAGLCTPVAGVLLALHSILYGFGHPADRWHLLSLGGMGAALTLLGPGVWSVDARLFGWKRIDIPREMPPE